MVKTWKPIFAAFVIFSAGAVTGAWAVKLTSQSAASPSRSFQGSWSAAQRAAFMDRMERELQLTASQRQNIEKILQESQDQIKLICDTISPRVGEEHKQARQRIRAELTPEQNEKFSQVYKRKFRNGSSQRYGSGSSSRNRSETAPSSVDPKKADPAPAQSPD